MADGPIAPMILVGMDGGRSAEVEVHVLACAACPRVSSFSARGWKAYLIDEGDEDQEVAFYCPACATGELGRDS